MGTEINFNLTDEACSALNSYWVGYIDDIMNIANAIANVQEEYINETKYEPIFKMSSEFENYFNDNIKNQIVRNLEEWRDSEFGIANATKAMKNSEEAIVKAQSLEQNIIDEFCERWKLEVIATQPDLTDTNVNAHKISLLSDEFNAYRTKIEEMHSEALNGIKNLCEENLLYVALENIVEIVGKNTEGLFEKLELLLQNLSEEFESASGVQIDRTEEETDSLSQRVEADVQSIVESMYKVDFDI